MNRRPLAAERFRVPLQAAISVAALLALSGIASYLLDLPLLRRFIPGYPPMKFATAIGLLAAAGAVRSLVTGNRVLAIGGAAVTTLIGVVTMVEYLTGASLGIDRIMVDQASLLTALFPGRMSVASALCLIMIGTGTLELTVVRRGPGSRHTAGILGTITAMLALTMLFSYATDVLSSLRFGYVMSISIPGAISMAALGMALMMIAWHLTSSLAVFPMWFPLGSGAAVLVTAFLMSGALAISERERALGQVRDHARTVLYQIENQIEAVLRPVRQLGELTADSSTAMPTEWTNSAASAVANTPGLVAVEWVDANFRPLVQPARPRWERFDSPTLATLFSAWPPSQRVTPGSQFVVASDWPTMLIAATPSCAVDRCNGVTLALLNPGLLLEPILAKSVGGYGFEIATPLRPVFQSEGESVGPEWTASIDTVMNGLHWAVRAWPEPRSIALLISDLPAVVAGLGFIVSALLAAMLQLVQDSVTTARSTERERIATAIEGNTEGIWEFEIPTGRGLRSPGLWRQLGYDPASVRADDAPALWASLIHTTDRPAVDAAIAEHVEGRTDAIAIEYRVEGREGWHWIVDRGRVVERDEDQRAVRLLGTSSDVTERKRAEELLASSERRFRAVFNSGFQFESLLDRDCILLEANRTSLEFAGVELEDVRGKPFWDTPWWSHAPGAQQRLQDACREANEGKTVQYQDEVQGAGDRRALIDFSLKPILDADGNVVQLLAEGRDITERKRAEDSVREMDTLGTIGRLAARVAHEINNPLAGIQNSFLLIKDAVPETHPYFSYVGAIEREIGRIAAVTRQLYETFRPESDGTADSSVSVVISDAVTMLKQVNRAAQVQIEVDTSRAPSILAIPSPLLRQAVYNLVQNAVEASPPGGVVTVTAWREGDVFWLAVRDHGPGVPPAMREQIFEPFVTTKGSIATGGMGLGLSLVRRALQAMGGRIEVNDAPGGGAEFRIRLPIT